MHSDQQYERRRAMDPDVREIKELVKEMKSTLDSHVEKLNKYEPNIVTLIDLLTVSRGLIWALKLLIYIGAPLVAVVVFFKDHWKL